MHANWFPALHYANNVVASPKCSLSLFTAFSDY
ncbi:hypothetical protein T11_7953 [Trichinella zimbabwensis]|uniref:Uncharacterized protein n=1 Tax=Trichinella zimbabwensis TaxID=268475 RepID=A0A0V1GL20_9BILA|nr:hypothetical protein T11_732 [Trichinella zimbabwensis]KRY98862.1 hypothetical protein T11_7953 [Trichinella zimbabwensis]